MNRARWILLVLCGCASGPTQEQKEHLNFEYLHQKQLLNNRVVDSANSYANSTEASESIAVAVLSDCSANITAVVNAYAEKSYAETSGSQNARLMVENAKPAMRDNIERAITRDVIAFIVKARAAKSAPK